MITITERIPVPHPPEIVWGVLSDPATVVSCIDGSELGAQHEDGTFDARLAVKFAAIRVVFDARVALELEEADRVGRMEARGADSRGSTRVEGHATFTVIPTTEGADVVLDGVIELNGQLASLVTTGAAVVVERMTRTFSEKLTATCAERDPNATSPVAVAPRPAAARRFMERVRRAWGRLRDAWSARRADRSQRRVDA